MSSAARGTKRKPVSPRGKRPETSKTSSRSCAVESEKITSVEDVKEELCQGTLG